MHNYYLPFDDAMVQLESEGYWASAARLVYARWEINPSDIQALLCAGTQLWYTVYMIEQLELPESSKSVEHLDMDCIQTKLMEITNYGLQNFSQNAIFNSYFGYMIHTMPYYFLDFNGDYCGWQEMGMDMVKKAHILEPDNPFVTAIYYEKTDSYMGSAYINACKELWQLADCEEWGNSCVQQYFGAILNAKSF